jgi:hypothetical protein
MSAKQMRVTQEALTKALNKKRFKWVDAVMKEEVPSDIYHSMKSVNMDDRKRAYQWLKERGYYIKDEGEGVCRIMKGTTLVRQTKLVLELDKPEELLQVMEAVTENLHIPPPPWQPKDV